MATTRTKVMKHIRSMMASTRKGVLEHADRLLKSGAVDLGEFDDDFRLPKILLHVALKQMAEQWSPLYRDRDIDRMIKNLERF